MERRVLLAFLLSFFVFLLFVRFFGPESAPPAPPGGETPAAATVTPPTAPAPSIAAPEAMSPAVPTEAREAEREQTIAVETSRYVAEFSNRGARLLGLRLLDHTDSVGAPLEALPQGDDLVNSVRPLDVVLPGDPAPSRLATALHEVAVDGHVRTGPIRLELRDGESRELEFRWASTDGLEVSKTIRMRGGDYRMGVSVSAIRGGAEQLKEVLFGPGIENESSVGTYQGAEQGVIESGGESRLFSFAESAGGEAESLSAQAVGVASHYFAGLLVADPGQRYEARLEALEIPWASFEVVPEDTATGSRELLVAHLRSAGASEFTLFAGPKQVELLTELGVDIVEFGAWLRFLVVPIRQGLLWAFDLLGNYGWAIVLVTILISLLLAPLKHYSYVSIRRMQKISPQVKRIQDKYKGLKPTDPKRSEMNQEMVALYRDRKSVV